MSKPPSASTSSSWNKTRKKRENEKTQHNNYHKRTSNHNNRSETARRSQNNRREIATLRNTNVKLRQTTIEPPLQNRADLGALKPITDWTPAVKIKHEGGTDS